MNSVSVGVKSLFNNTVSLLNQPVVKEGVKNIAGSVTFVFGLVEIYDIYQIARGAEISSEVSSKSPKWIHIADKVIIVCAKTSLVLSAGVSRPGVFMISSLVGSVFSSTQIDRLFGPNTIFALNPRHPRHVVSIAAVILALPSVAQTTYKGINWVYRKVRQYQVSPTDKKSLQKGLNQKFKKVQRKLSTDNNSDRPCLSDAKIRLMSLFNTITSRPALHIGNQLGRFILHHI